MDYLVNYSDEGDEILTNPQQIDQEIQAKITALATPKEDFGDINMYLPKGAIEAWKEKLKIPSPVSLPSIGKPCVSLVGDHTDVVSETEPKTLKGKSIVELK